MQAFASSCGVLPTAKPRAWLCLLLAILFLYNPFQAVPASASGLHAHRAASNRATVGASELQHFRAKERGVVQAELECMAKDFPFASAEVSEVLIAPERKAPVRQAVLPASLWFRPPPQQ